MKTSLTRFVRLRATTVVAVIAAVLALSSASAAQGQETVVYFHTDAIGSVRMVTSSTGSEVARYDFLPFGEDWPASPTGTESRRFTGQERDGGTKFDYFGARYYQSQTGRFTTPDMPGIDQNAFDPQSWNLFGYVRNNPLRYTDPTGQKCENGYNAETGAFCTETIDDAWLDVQNFFRDSWWNLQQQLVNAQTATGDVLTKVHTLIPTMCGGGAFGYGGGGFAAGQVHGELLGLMQYDSSLGGSHGGLVGAGMGSFTAGIESMRSWGDWTTHTAPIALAGREIRGASKRFGKRVDVQSGDFGGLAQYENGSISLGIYAGATLGSRRTFGGGAYATFGWMRC